MKKNNTYTNKQKYFNMTSESNHNHGDLREIERKHEYSNLNNFRFHRAFIIINVSFQLLAGFPSRIHQHPFFCPLRPLHRGSIPILSSIHDTLSTPFIYLIFGLPLNLFYYHFLICTRYSTFTVLSICPYHCSLLISTVFNIKCLLLPF